ncbi:hypothetical protein AK830_g7045 [Neonectria ditissima]|uniref:Uncharacterized protein n=1 Tax=Neonectria ditissima TaxID=78410 RepID=A0A0P7BGX8_9HYPO|nr:hypothetical protein AK830_g7045 [Neonectria ditissima]
MKTPKSKKRPKSKDSVEFNHRPFSDFQNPGTPSRELSTFSWVDDALALTPESPTKHRSAKHSLVGASGIANTKSAAAPTRPPIKGTGAHDDFLTRSQGLYRHPSLRRGSGQTVGTPKGVRRAITRQKKMENRPKNPVNEQTATSVSSNSGDIPMASEDAKKAPLPAITDWGNDPYRPQRGDVPPLIRTLAPRALSQLSFPEKTHVLKVCYKSRKVFLNLPRKVHQSEEEFWVVILAQLQPASDSSYIFGNWETLQSNVNSWCDVRRVELREGNLSPPRDSRQDLDLAIDAWNRIWLKRFCSVNRGCVETTILRGVLSFIKTELFEWTSTVLQQRREELEALARPKMLRNDSNLEEYSEFVGHLERTIKSGGRNSFKIREAEAVMSFVADLQPRLKEAIRQHLPPALDNHVAEESVLDQEIIEVSSDSDENQNEVLVSIETPDHTPQSLAKLHTHTKKSSSQSKKRMKQPSPPLDEASILPVKKRKTSRDSPPKSPPTSLSKALLESLPERLQEHLPERPQEHLPVRLAEVQRVVQHTYSQQQRDGSMSQQHFDSLQVESPRSVSSMSSFLPLSELLNSSLTSGPTTASSSRPSSLNLTPFHSKAKSPIRDEGEHPPTLEVKAESGLIGPRQEDAFPGRPYQGGLGGHGSNQDPTKIHDGTKSPSIPGQSEWRDVPNLLNSSQTDRDGTGLGTPRPSDQGDGKAAERDQGSPPLRFRESTADFRAMTPDSRSDMMFRALRTVMRKTNW